MYPYTNLGFNGRPRVLSVVFEVWNIFHDFFYSLSFKSATT